MTALVVGFVLLIDVLWAFNMVAIKESVTHIPPLLSVALRYGFVFLGCASCLRIVHGRMGLILLSSVIAGALQFGLGAYSFHVTENLSALAIANQLGVPLSLILAILIDGERIAWRRTLGILLALAGVVLLVFDPDIVDERLGVLLTFAASFCWAVGNMMIRRMVGVPMLTLYAWQSAICVPLLLLASFWLEPGSYAGLPMAPLSAFAWVAYSGIAASLIGHVGMGWLVQRYPITVITPLTLPTPVLSVVCATLYYGTPITPLMWVGGVLTLAGVATITIRSVQKATEER